MTMRHIATNLDHCAEIDRAYRSRGGPPHRDVHEATASGPLFLGDYSAVARIRHETLSAVLTPLLASGGVATCDYRVRLTELRTNYTSLPITPAICAGESMDANPALRQGLRPDRFHY
jgi:hypothetical protein